MGVALKSLFNYEKLNHSGSAVYSFAPLPDPAAAADASADLLTPPVLGVVGDVGDKRTKSPVNSINPELLPSNPHIPHILPHDEREWGEEEVIDGFEEAGPAEDVGWDVL